MSEENRKTIEVYKNKAKIYLANNIKHDKFDTAKAKQKRENLEELIRNNFASLPKHAKVFEIGSADGVNAKFIESLGFKVTASDIADNFIEATRNNGLKTIKFNAIEDKFSEKYYGVFCWRVFVHFTKEDALKVIKKVYNSLENGGVFIFNVISREIKNTDKEWVDFEGDHRMGEKRFYHYFSKKDLDDLIKQTQFRIKDFYKEGGKENNKWLVYVLEK